MGTYWYIKDPDSDEGITPVFEDDYVTAIFRIAKENGVKITDEMILKELKRSWKKEEYES